MTHISNDFFPMNLPTATEMAHLFDMFTKKFDRDYDADERITRYTNFQKNVERIVKSNQAYNEALFHINHLADLTKDEIAARLAQPPTERRIHVKDYAKRVGIIIKNDTALILDTDPNFDPQEAGIPDEYDLADEGCVTPVRNQGVCGSCWAFGAAGAIETSLCKAAGKMVTHLSTQHMVECNTLEGRWQLHPDDVKAAEKLGFHPKPQKGCFGAGSVHRPMRWLVHHGVYREEDYPYTQLKHRYPGECRFDIRDKRYKVVDEAYNLSYKNGNTLAKHIYEHGGLGYGYIVFDELAFWAGRAPLTQEMCEATASSIPHGYRGGHVVTAVGYRLNQVTGRLVLRLKNSWGDHWGEGGYFEMEHGACAGGWTAGGVSVSVPAESNLFVDWPVEVTTEPVDLEEVEEEGQDAVVRV